VAFNFYYPEGPLRHIIGKNALGQKHLLQRCFSNVSFVCKGTSVLGLVRTLSCHENSCVITAIKFISFHTIVYDLHHLRYTIGRLLLVIFTIH